MNPRSQKVQFVLSMDTEEESDWDGPLPDQNAPISNINEQPAFLEGSHEIELCAISEASKKLGAETDKRSEQVSSKR